MSEVSRVSCGLCHYEFIHGAKVCQGCQGTIVYGPTQAEVAESAKLWSVMMGMVVAFLVYMLPFILVTNWGFKVAVGWGLGIWGLAGLGVAFAYGFIYGRNKAVDDHIGKVRTFRRM